jgi:hypothetical protein
VGFMPATIRVAGSSGLGYAEVAARNRGTRNKGLMLEAVYSPITSLGGRESLGQQATPYTERMLLGGGGGLLMDGKGVWPDVAADALRSRRPARYARWRLCVIVRER